MQLRKWKPYVIGILITEAVGALAGFLIRDGTEIYAQTVNKPPLSPPMIVFPIVWGLLYAAMGISGARLWLAEGSGGRKRSLNLFVTQLIVNFFWPLFFFNLQAFGFALAWLILLWALVFLLIITARKVDAIAAWLLVPYLLWLTFALYLNAGVTLLN